MYSAILAIALIACAYASPIQVYQPTGTPIPPVPCDDALCTGKADGNYRHPSYPRYFVTCLGGKAISCKRCADGLFFNPFCDQCRLEADQDSPNCDYYTGVTLKNNVCSVEDNGYAVWFCQNLVHIYGVDYKDKSGDYPFDIHAQISPYGFISKKPTFYISCVEGMYGWCRFCPANLIWYTVKEGGVERKECGICDYPPTVAPGR